MELYIRFGILIGVVYILFGIVSILNKRKLSEQELDNVPDNINSWSDTILLSTCIFSFIYLLFYPFSYKLIDGLLLNDLIFYGEVLVLYCGVWVLIRQIKIMQVLKGKAIGNFLMLFNRNTGLNTVNYLIMIMAIVAIIVSVIVSNWYFIPLSVAIFTGILVNHKYITKQSWDIINRFNEHTLAEVKTNTGTGDKQQRYEWTFESCTTELRGKLELYFTQNDIRAFRESNPFAINSTKNFDRNLKQLFREVSGSRHLRLISNYISQIAKEEKLSEFETLQFTLDFLQDANIKCYTLEGSNTIYFPEETLLNKEGNKNSKTILAAALLREAGYKVAYVIIDAQIIISVAYPDKWFDGYNIETMFGAEAQSFVGENGYRYYFYQIGYNASLYTETDILDRDNLGEIRYLK